ncbi:MAG: TFIIB-type zinc ribbon-containing protein [Gammaproteobacteria bacterium]
MSQCPHCKDQTLKPTALAEGLPAETCARCGGALVSLLSYRVWIERNPVAAQLAREQQSDSRVEADDTRTALNCPKCSGIMTKYRIASAADNKIDLCVRCNDVWLDDGEWELIQSLHLTGKLPEIFYDSWQKRIRKEQSEVLKEQKFKELLGDDYDEIVRIRDWIAGHEQRRTLLDFLNAL